MTKRWLGIATATLGVVLVVLGVLSRDWVHGIDLGIESHLGLQELELCQMVEPETGVRVRSCETVALDAIGEGQFVPDGFARFHTLAIIAFWAGLAAAFLCLVCVVLGVLDRPLDLPVHPTTLAILASATALMVGGITLTLNPYSKLVGWGSGRGFVLYGIGTALGLFGAIVLGQNRRLPLSEWEA
jgi:hypothetical protein